LTVKDSLSHPWIKGAEVSIPSWNTIEPVYQPPSPTPLQPLPASATNDEDSQPISSAVGDEKERLISNAPGDEIKQITSSATPDNVNYEIQVTVKRGENPKPTPIQVQVQPARKEDKIVAPLPAPPASIPIPVLHVGKTSTTSSRSSSEEEFWSPRSLLESKSERMTSSLSKSRDLLSDLKKERGALEKDLRVFSESVSLMSDDSVVNLRQRMARRIAEMEDSFNHFAEDRSKTRRQMTSLFGNDGQIDHLQKRFKQSKARFRNLIGDSAL
uniref:Uncharacterized protein n=1 Tax=Ciona savignyi TaxID=51511 RepID=H2YD10_CIOSA